MANTIGIFITTVATAVGLKLAGQAVPVLAPLTMGTKILKEIDSEMEKAAAKSVLEANRNPDGSTPNIVMLTFYTGSEGKADLERYVAKQGGTAWFQTGANARLQAFWHHSKSFRPKSAPKCNIGFVVHGTKAGI